MKFQYTTFNKRILLRSIMTSAALIGVVMTPSVAFADTVNDIENNSEKSTLSNTIIDANNANNSDNKIENTILSENNIDNNVDTENIVLDQNTNKNSKTTSIIEANIENNDPGLIADKKIDSILVESKISAIGQNQDQLLTTASTPTVIQSGVSGTCTWKIYDDGSLIIAPTDPNAESGELADEFAPYVENPWKNYRSQIKSVKFEKHIIAKNCAGMFSNLTQLTSIDLKNLDASNAIDVRGMFGGCSALTSLDLSDFDISNATNTCSMFSNCTNLSSINFNNFKISKTTDMSAMFASCPNLISLDLSSFDTSNVTNMDNMFNNCNNLSSVNLRSFDTSKVTSMLAMFYGCQSLTSLDLSSFDTSNVINMASMFIGCTGLKELDLKNFYTPKASNMSTMFAGCQNLTSLDLSNFETSETTIISAMFGGCQNLKTLLLSNKSILNPSTALKESKWIDTNNVVYDTTASMLSANRTAPTTYRSFIFKIDDASVSNISDATYSGKEIKPKPVVSLNGKTLTENTDYKLSYSDNINAGKASIILTGIGDYAGLISQNFNILKVNPSTKEASELFELTPVTKNEDVTNVSILPKEGITGTGDVITEYSSDGNTWTKDAPTIPGTYNVRANVSGGKNMEAGIVTDPSWQIVIKAKIFDNSKATVTPNSDVYTGKPIPITVTLVSSDGKTLVENVDYTIVYTDNKGNAINANNIIDAGDYITTITGINQYTGSNAIIKFTINKADCKAPDMNKFTISDNSITGVDDSMEYSNNNGSTWVSIPIGITELNNLSANIYLIRYKGDENHNPSEAVSLAVGDKTDASLLNNDADMPKTDNGGKINDNTSKSKDSLIRDNTVKSIKNETRVANSIPQTGDDMGKFGTLWAILSSEILAGLGLYSLLRKRKKDE